MGGWIYNKKHETDESRILSKNLLLNKYPIHP